MEDDKGYKTVKIRVPKLKLGNTNFLAVSILVSALVLSGTLIYVFGPGGGPDANTAALAPAAPGGNTGGQAAGSSLDIVSLKALARDLGADGGEFDSCLDSDRHTAAVQADLDEGTQLGIRGTPGFFVNGSSVSGAQPFENFASVIDRELASPTPLSVDVGDAPFLGNADAPVTMVEFSDYECPFCQRFFSSTLDSIKSTYIDTGQVRFVYKDFPLTSIHPRAQKAAEAARCVRDQLGDDGYWAMHDAMFGGV